MPHDDDIARRFAQACALAARGEHDAARQAYLELLAQAPDHAGALNNLGTLLFETGFRSAARTAYGQAVAVHPDDATGRVNLGNLLLAEGQYDEARQQFERALAVSPDHGDAHRGLAYCLDEAGDVEAARRHRDAGFAGRAVTRLPYRGAGPAIPILVLVAARGGNIPTRFLLDDRIFATTVIVADYFDATQPLPGHRLLFNTIGDADLASDALSAAERIAARSTAPVVNPPQRIAGTGRAQVAGRLADISGLRAPRTVELSRAAFDHGASKAVLATQGLSFPLLLRTLGYHTGRHFVRIDRPQDLERVAAALPGDRLLAIEYLDARGGDGRWRKYRVMMIGGRLYPLHLAVAADWKVHYFTAAMADHPEFRAEEQGFLEDIAYALGDRAMEALQGACAALALDYGGIDFGVDAEGSVLLFEANATMVINPPEPDPRWDYRRPAIHRALDAVKDLLMAKAGESPPLPAHGER